ncbi:MAG: hypothetical protein JW809_18790 [Pirellulales bacterium]|nr:hypothetical protein [Pirellulales bacterium]
MVPLAMSLLLVIAPALTVIVYLVVWMAIRLVTRRSRWHRAIPIVVLLGCLPFFPLLCSGIFTGVHQATRWEATDISPDKANRLLVLFKIPQTATNVSCVHDRFAPTVDSAEFTIDEVGFLNWASENGWVPTKFDSRADSRDSTPSSRATGPFGLDEDGRPIVCGYTIDTSEKSDPDCGLWVLYNLDTHRCSCSYSLW